MLPVRINAHPTKYRPSPASLTAILNVQKNNEGRVAAALMVDLVLCYFLRAYFSESSATAKMMMPPLMMYCQYGFTPM